jgi:hypothetical protein
VIKLLALAMRPCDLYGEVFVKGVPQGSYPFSFPSLLDLIARFFAPTHAIE